MPPKKKVDPELQQQQFEQYLQTDEYKKWEELNVLFKKYERVTETTIDINGPWQIFFDELMSFFGVLKIKTGKIKELKHEFIRSFFFARDDKEGEKIYIIIDGMRAATPKQFADDAWSLRHKYCTITKAIEDLEDSMTFNAQTYQTVRKNLIKTIQEFFKYFNRHCKSGHKEIYEPIMFKILEPISNLIYINAQLVQFNLKYKNDQEKEVRSFKLKAIIEKYQIAFQEVVRIFSQENKSPNPIPTPNLKNMFYKLSYKNWNNNPCEKLYIKPLNDSFLQIQKILWRLYANGINYWRIPLNSNEELLEETIKLLNAELIAERLLGMPIRRELFNFVYKVVEIIKNSNDYLAHNLLNKDEHTVSGSIPKLVIFKQIQHMRIWKDEKKDNEDKTNDNQKRIQIINQKKEESVSSKKIFKITELSINDSSLNESILTNHTSTQLSYLKEMQSNLAVKSQVKSPTNKQPIFNFCDEIEDPINDPVERQETELFGRYFFLENFISEEKRPIFEQCVEDLKSINPAVQQDIEDIIICQGFTPDKQRNDPAIKEAKEKLYNLNIEDNADLEVKLVRPPELWNYPDAVEKHKFRSIAKPKECYLDGRFEEFDEKLNQLKDHLISFKPQNWREIVIRIIDVFRDQYNKEVSVIDPNEKI